jgi:hypothetical protein
VGQVHVGDPLGGVHDVVQGHHLGRGSPVHGKSRDEETAAGGRGAIVTAGASAFGHDLSGSGGAGRRSHGAGRG